MNKTKLKQNIQGIKIAKHCFKRKLGFRNVFIFLRRSETEEGLLLTLIFYLIYSGKEQGDEGQDRKWCKE